MRNLDLYTATRRAVDRALWTRRRMVSESILDPAAWRSIFQAPA